MYHFFATKYWAAKNHTLSCTYFTNLKIKPIEKIYPLEVWKPICGYENHYEISESGIVRSIERKVSWFKGSRTIKSRIIQSRINNRGYMELRLSKNGIAKSKFSHILTAIAFVPNPDNKPEVNHLDGDKLNNHYTNFSWVTHSENIQHAYDTGLIKKKTTPVIDICTGMEFSSIKKAAEFNNFKYSTCKNQLSGKRKNSTCLRYLSSSAA
jgi:hypothetical protein